MIRMQRSKPRTAGTKMRSRRVTMRFTDDSGAVGLVLKSKEVVDCDLCNGVLQTLPEWEYMLDENGNKFNCNIPNTLEVGSFKVDEGGKAYKNAYYLITRAGSYLYYMADAPGYYSVAVNRTQVVPFFVREASTPRVALCTRKGFLMSSLDGSYKTVIENDTLAAGALFKHRVFVALKGGVLKYSAPEDFSNFGETENLGGSMAFPHCGGEIIAMKPYQDTLYIFFKSGIMRLKAGGEPSGFYAERLDYAGGDIFSRTICVCQHAIYFLSRSGLYRLKGKKTERLDLDVDFPQEETGFEGCSVWKDRPMIRYHVGDDVYKTIIVGKDGKSAFFMKDLADLGRGEDGRVFFTDKGKYLCQLTDKGTYWFDGRFNTQATDFGYSGKKRLKCLRFYGEGSFTLSILWNGMIVNKHLEFVNGVAEWRFDRMEYGEEYQMTFELGRMTKITSVQAEYKTVA